MTNHYLMNEGDKINQSSLDRFNWVLISTFNGSEAQFINKHLKHRQAHPHQNHHSLDHRNPRKQ